MRKNILQYLEESVLRFPEKTAFSNGKEDISFAELHRASRAVGSALLARGAHREAVAIFTDKHPYAMAASFGVIYAGCFYVIIDPSMPVERVKLILDMVGARFIIAADKCYAKAEAFGVQHLLRYGEAASTDAD